MIPGGAQVCQNDQLCDDKMGLCGQWVSHPCLCNETATTRLSKLAQVYCAGNILWISSHVNDRRAVCPWKQRNFAFGTPDFALSPLMVGSDQGLLAVQKPSWEWFWEQIEFGVDVRSFRKTWQVQKTVPLTLCWPSSRYSSGRVAITIYHKLGGLNINLFPHCCGGWSLRSECQHSWVLAPSFVGRWLTSPCVLTPLCLRYDVGYQLWSFERLNTRELPNITFWD